MEEEEDRHCCGNAEEEQALLSGLPLQALSEYLGVVFQREIDRRKTFLYILYYRAEVAATYIEAHIDATRVVFAR